MYLDLIRWNISDAGSPQHFSTSKCVFGNMHGKRCDSPSSKCKQQLQLSACAVHVQLHPLVFLFLCFLWKTKTTCLSNVREVVIGSFTSLLLCLVFPELSWNSKFPPCILFNCLLKMGNSTCSSFIVKASEDIIKLCDFHVKDPSSLYKSGTFTLCCILESHETKTPQQS